MLTRTLSSAGHNVAVIDLDRENASSLDSEKVASGAIRIVEGDGMRDETLEEARITEADLFIALTDSDSVNGLAALKAKMSFRVMTVIAAVRSNDLTNVYESLGVACVNPGKLTADAVIATMPEVLSSIGEARP
jgi:trk system potassium uptake protein TrkA